ANGKLARRRESVQLWRLSLLSLPLLLDECPSTSLAETCLMPAGPFSGLLVIDLTRVLAGPFCTLLLAELGARVLKVENPDGGDHTRQFVPSWKEKSAYYLSLNRGKESIALNLKNDRDREVLLAMVRRGDVLVENYRPGTLDKLDLGYERLHELNPR